MELRWAVVLLAHAGVSIPERVWGGLELPDPILERDQFDVSIPERVWGGLERYARRW